MLCGTSDGPRQGVEVRIDECPVFQSKVDWHLYQVEVVFRFRRGVREQVLSDYWQRGGTRDTQDIEIGAASRTMTMRR